MNNRFKRSAAVIAAASIAASCTVTTSAKTISQLMSESRSMQNSISENQSQLNSAQSTKAAAESDLAVLDTQLSSVQNELTVLNRKLAATTVKLQKSQEELDAAVEKKNEQHDILLKRIRVMYENGSSGYMDALFESTDFTDFFKRLEYANAIMNYDRKLLESYEAAEEIIAQNVETIKVEKTNIETLQQQQSEKQTQLNTAIAEKRALIAQMDSESATYAQNIAALQQQDAAVQRLILQAQAISAAASRQSESTAGNRRAYSNNYSYNNNYSNYNNYNYNYNYSYTPPVQSTTDNLPAVATAEAVDNSNTNTTTTYDNESSAGFGYDDEQAGISSDVVAAAEGTVIYAGNRAGYGKCVVVDHGDGYTTVYANNNYIDVSLGQTVKRGDIIGGAGDSGYSSGQYNDFEAKIGGQHSNVDSYIDK
jgi:septal ring factor EnvC (AmiA/AmiB activator)